MYEFKGIVKKILDVKVFDSGFQIQTVVVEDPDSKYPQPIPFDVKGDKVSIVANLKEGDSITVSFDLNGREWTSPQGDVKYFCGLNAWRINTGDASSQGSAPAPGSQDGDPLLDYEPASDGDGDDNLPF